MDQQEGKITLIWVPGHVSITGNENIDTTTKEVLNDRIQSTKKYPLHKVDRTETSRRATSKWNNTTTEMKDRKPHIRSIKDTQKMTRRDQVLISRLRTGYCRATHGAIMNREPRPECPFCGVPHPMAM
jgi:hypothetical protein